MPVYYSKQLTQSGGKGQIPLIKVVGWSVADHEDLLDAFAGLPKSLWSSHWPGENERWEYNSKRLPRLLVRESLRDKLAELGAVAVANEYYEVVAVRLKMELWKKQTPEWNTGIGAEDDPTKKMWVRLGIDEYFRKKNRAAVRNLHHSGNKIHALDELVSSSELRTNRLRDAIKTINGWVENLDLGQRFQVKRTVERIELAEMDQEAEVYPQQQGTTPSIADEMRDLTPAEAAELVKEKPWLRSLAEATGLM